jgi:pimeloyl-ACP methyl ester carboxylesterase
MSLPEPSYRDVGDRRSGYGLRPGASPTIVFLSGYASDMDGTKASALDEFAQRRGLACLRFDYSGTGLSGGRFDEGTLDRWIEEALDLFDNLTEGPILLVGSSMGAWISLHLARQRPGRIKGFIGLAAAPDFTEWGFGPEVKAQLAAHGHVGDPHPEGRATPLMLTHHFWESGQRHLLLNSKIAVDCPVRLVHGDADREVPLDIAFRAMRALRSADVQLKIVKGAGHRLSEPHEIDAILRTVSELLEPVS